MFPAKRRRFLQDPRKSNRRKFRRCLFRKASPHDRLHFSTFSPSVFSSLSLSLFALSHVLRTPEILEEEPRTVLLYFFAAITFERFKTFCLYFSRGQRPKVSHASAIYFPSISPSRVRAVEIKERILRRDWHTTICEQTRELLLI